MAALLAVGLLLATLPAASASRIDLSDALLVSALRGSDRDRVDRLLIAAAADGGFSRGDVETALLLGTLDDDGIGHDDDLRGLLVWSALSGHRLSSRDAETLLLIETLQDDRFGDRDAIQRLILLDALGVGSFRIHGDAATLLWLSAMRDQDTTS